MFTFIECEDIWNWLVIFWIVSFHILGRQQACPRNLKSKHIDMVSELVRFLAIPWSFHSNTKGAFRERKLHICFLWNNLFSLEQITWHFSKLKMRNSFLNSKCLGFLEILDSRDSSWNFSLKQIENLGVFPPLVLLLG